MMALPTLGDVIRQQREMHDFTLRQMADMAGISNPYLSQIERGLREPSEAVVDAIADALDLSIESLYSAAGISPQPDEQVGEVQAAIEKDPYLKPAQRRALLESYNAFLAANGASRPRPRGRSRRNAGD